MSLACGGVATATAARARQLQQQQSGSRAAVACGGAATASSSSPAQGRLRTVSVRAAWRPSAASSGRGLALSLFHRFRGGLPPDGEILPPDEQSCDPYVDTCRTPLYVHESACPSCGGCGYARAQGRGRGGHGRGGAGRHAFRGALHACLACHGLGYARYATVEPPPEATYLTLARPAEADPRSVSAARLRQALRGMGAGAGAGGGAGAAAGAAGAAGAAAASASAAASQQQQQQRQREREAARGSLDRTAFWRSVQDRWQQGTAAEGSAAAAAAASAPPRPTSSPAPSKR